MKLLHDVIHTHTHLDQDSDVSWEHNTTKFTNDLRKNCTCDCTVQNKFRRMISQKEKKNIRRSTQRSALCKINRQVMRWRSHAIVKPLVVKHALCPVRAFSQWDALVFCFASLQWLCVYLRAKGSYVRFSKLSGNRVWKCWKLSCNFHATYAC